MKHTKVIISVTSHTAQRMADLPKFLYHSIIKYNFDYVKIVLTLHKDDIKYITPELQLLIDAELIELLVADINLTCNLKYFYVMQKYRDLPIITIDDDSIYPRNMIPDLLRAHKKYPNCVIARSARIISKNTSYDLWPECVKGLTRVKWLLHDKVCDNLSPEGYAGVLYPANILQLTNDHVTFVKNFLRSDDLCLTCIERLLNIKCVVPYYSYNKLTYNTKGFDAISLKSDNIRAINGLIAKYLHI